MMALQLLPVLQVIVILFSPTTYGIPVYGTKRYGRSSSVHRASNPYWGSQVQPHQQMVRTQRYPLSYYEMYPYGQSYPDDYYYPQESYPMYYPARTSKYEVYQAVLPYYYNDRPIMRPGYGYYGYSDSAEPVVDLEEEMLHEAEREEREDAQPIGQEMYYENESSDNNDANFDDVNAAFLQNLIMSQMYKDALDQKNYYQKSPSDNYYGDDAYGKWEEYPEESRQDYYQEDEDVRELKQLANPHKSNKSFRKNLDKKPNTEERLHWFQRSGSKHPNQKYDDDDDEEGEEEQQPWYNYENKRSVLEASTDDMYDFSKHGLSIFGKEKLAFTDRKAKLADTTTTTEALLSSTEAPKRDARGQKEEVLMRPATPVRHPFSAPVVNLMSKNDVEKKRTPSVYDTIKHMLDMEENLENNYAAEDVKPAMRKRIISSEDSLTQQLSVLKKTQ